MAGMTRDEQKPEYLYIEPDGSAFFTPDGEGRIYYDSDEDALEEHEPAGIVMLDEPAEDF